MIRRPPHTTRVFSPWIVVLSLLIGSILAILFFAFLIFFLPVENNTTKAQPVMTILPAATLTPSLIPVTPQKAENVGATPIPPGNISVGVYVQIVGTGNDGLRLRVGAGINYRTPFIGMDNEVFLVKDGPKEGDGFTWWYLTAPYDTNRSGWAAANYLSVIEKP